MTRSKPSLLVTSLCPDRLNTNYRIRHAVAQGAEESGLLSRVEQAAIEGVLARGAIEVDIVLAVGSGASDIVSFETLARHVRAAGAMLVFWTHEDPYEFDLNRRLLGYCDWFFTNEASALPFYDTERVSWLPLAADLSFLRPLRPFSDRRIDLFFCGYGYPLRLHVLEKIVSSDARFFNLGLFGPNLRARLGDAASERRLPTEEFAETCAYSKIVLNIGRDLNIANKRFNIVPETPGPRTFDVALAGAPQLLFDDGVDIDCFYTPGKEILLFDNASDVVEAIKMLQEDPRHGERLAEAAQQRTKKEHLYKHRIARMLEVIGDEQRDRQTSSAGSAS